MRKRILPLLLTLCMVLTMIPASFAANETAAGTGSSNNTDEGIQISDIGFDASASKAKTDIQNALQKAGAVNSEITMDSSITKDVMWAVAKNMTPGTEYAINFKTGSQEVFAKDLGTDNDKVVPANRYFKADANGVGVIYFTSGTDSSEEQTVPTSIQAIAAGCYTATLYVDLNSTSEAGARNWSATKAAPKSIYLTSKNSTFQKLAIIPSESKYIENPVLGNWEKPSDTVADWGAQCVYVKLNGDVKSGDKFLIEVSKGDKKHYDAWTPSGTDGNRGRFYFSFNNPKHFDKMLEKGLLPAGTYNISLNYINDQSSNAETSDTDQTTTLTANDYTEVASTTVEVTDVEAKQTYSKRADDVISGTVKWQQAYTNAGITFDPTAGKITVNMKTLKEYVMNEKIGTANDKEKVLTALTHVSSADATKYYLYCGVQYDAPPLNSNNSVFSGGATLNSAKLNNGNGYGTTEKFDTDSANDDGFDVASQKIIDYIRVAELTVDANKKVIAAKFAGYKDADATAGKFVYSPVVMWLGGDNHDMTHAITKVNITVEEDTSVYNDDFAVNFVASTLPGASEMPKLMAVENGYFEAPLFMDSEDKKGVWETKPSDVPNDRPFVGWKIQGGDDELYGVGAPVKYSEGITLVGVWETPSVNSRPTVTDEGLSATVGGATEEEKTKVTDSIAAAVADAAEAEAAGEKKEALLTVKATSNSEAAATTVKLPKDIVTALATAENTATESTEKVPVGVDIQTNNGDVKLSPEAITKLNSGENAGKDVEIKVEKVTQPELIQEADDKVTAAFEDVKKATASVVNVSVTVGGEEVFSEEAEAGLKVGHIRVAVTKPSYPKYVVIHFTTDAAGNITNMLRVKKANYDEDPDTGKINVRLSHLSGVVIAEETEATLNLDEEKDGEQSGDETTVVLDLDAETAEAQKTKEIEVDESFILTATLANAEADAEVELKPETGKEGVVEIKEITTGDNASTAAVKKFTVKGKTAGTVNLTATVKGTDATDTCTVTVKEKEPSGDKLALDESEITINAEGTKKLNASNVPTGATVEWSSSDRTIASVDQNGVVTGVKEGGPVTITAKAGDQEATCKVTVIGKDEPLPPTPTAEFTLKVENATGSIGKKVTISDVTKDNKYIVQIAKAGDTAGHAIFMLTAATEDDLVFHAAANSTVTVWEVAKDFDFSGAKPDKDLGTDSKDI